MKIKIGNKLIGDNQPCFIIAEAGVNHNGNLKLAKKLITAAKKAGADAVKFQTFRPESLLTKEAPISEYQKGKKQETQFELLTRLQLKEKDFKEISAFCKKEKIIFFSTPSDEKSADLLEKLGVPAFKISSSDQTHIPLLRHIAKKKLPIIMSTGASYLKEVKEAVRTIRKEGNKEIILLHNTSLYPLPLKDVNLKAMLTLKKEFGFPVGYSDHTRGINVSLAAVALGAKVIEKHFTLDRNLPGPDHKASLEPQELQSLVQGTREIETALLGSGQKKPVKDEGQERELGWRSIVVEKDISKGTIIKRDMLAVKRPGKGIRPKYLDKFLGKKAKKDIKADSLIRWQDIKN